MGIIWKKHLKSSVDVVINDPSNFVSDVIRQNAKSNEVEVEVVSKDPCALLHEIGFNFM
jgi:tRNA G26 N,N-dimethylase Trm1